MSYLKSKIDCVATVQEVAGEIGVYEVKGEDRGCGYDNVYVKIQDHDYYGSSLSRYRYKGTDPISYEDYKMFNISISFFKAVLKKDVREKLESLPRQKGRASMWNKALDNINNFYISEEDYDKATKFIKELFEESSERWGVPGCLMSDIETQIYNSRCGYPKFIGEIQVVFGFKKKGLIEKGEAPSKCNDCPYFTTQGVETSDEWVDFYYYCSKMNRSLEEFKDNSGNIDRPDICPLA